MTTQSEKGRLFRALHERDSAFLIPNPWDVGTARILAHLGFEALATTSAGYAFSAGQRDNTISRNKMMAHVTAIAVATDLPVSADLENGLAMDLKRRRNPSGWQRRRARSGAQSKMQLSSQEIPSTSTNMR